ncbi:Annexin A6 isoform X2 [Oopsacas minuta]|uniref:Annexin A6 isoform X2 n=1 Tax=Oopsacas minuta TaxID=111878 RepID=A0AAV7JE13_9METZ|nr:Annexin A6 isoform X2 [Oopsacas minuta]
MSEVLYLPALYPSNPLIDSRIRCLPDFLFGAPPAVVWGNPFVRPPPRAPSVKSLSTPEEPFYATPEALTPEPLTPEPLTPEPLTPEPMTISLLDDDVRRIRHCLVKKDNLFNVLLEILPNRSYEHRTKFIKRYRELFNRNMLEDLFKQTKPHNYYFAVRAMLDSYRVTRLHSLFIAMEGKATGRFLSFEGVGTDEEALAEILFMATNGQIHYCRNNWSENYRTYELEPQLVGETSGNFANLLASLSKGDRDETGFIDMKQVKVDVTEIYETDENRTSNLIHVFSKRSYEHLRLIVEEFQRQYGLDLGIFIANSYKSISGQIIGDDFINALKTFVHAVRDEVKFYAQRLYQSIEFLTHGSIKDLPIDIVSSRQTIVRIIIMKREFDLSEIKDAYLALSGIQLEVGVAECFKEAKFTALRQLLFALISETEDTILPEVQQIHAAVLKKGKANNILFSILSSCSYDNRLKIVSQYLVHYQVNLITKIEEFMKPGEQLFTIRALLESYERTSLRSIWISMEGKRVKIAKEAVEIDDSSLVDILFLATNSEISYFHEYYPRLTGYNLVEHVKKATGGKGKFTNLVLRLLEGKRWEESHSDNDLLKHDLSTLRQSINGERAEDDVIELFSLRSREHLKVLFNDFEEIYETKVVEHLSATFNAQKQASILSALQRCVIAIQNRNMYYALRLKNCLDFVQEKNENTPDSLSRKQTIMRILLTHVETDLRNIMECFASLSKEKLSLEQSIQRVIKENELVMVMTNLIDTDNEQEHFYD